MVTDEELVACARAGAQDAWAELVQRHHGAVFRTAHAALLSRDDAEDAAQEAWIAAWRHLDEFRGQATFRTWLLTITWRKALDRRRGVVAWMRAWRLTSADDEDAPPRLQLVAGGLSPEGQQVDRQARGQMKRLLKVLPRAYRDALLLMAARDVSYAEAAALLDAPVGTVKWRVSEARRMLKERLENTCGLRRSAVGPREDE